MKQKILAQQQDQREKPQGEFKVLKFMSQLHNKKIKVRTEGPCIASTIMKTSVCMLRTLHGINRPGFINGIKMKWYYGPLTFEPLLTNKHQNMEAKNVEIGSICNKTRS